MQKLFGTPVSGSNRINCTANDVRISGVSDFSPATCTQGIPFTLTATFTTVVTASERYDVGLFFRIDGGDNARGTGANATGVCSLSKLDPGTDTAVDLDGDSCGDLVAGTHEITVTIPGVACEDPDEDGFLNLPNCTSWHNGATTACNIANNVDFRPETKSKCVCDDDFQVPVIVASPDGVVTKVATQAEVTYRVTVVNTAQVPVTITALNDNIYCDITTNHAATTTPACGAVAGTTCASGTTLPVGDGVADTPGDTDGDTYTCTFRTTYVAPGTSGNLTNTVTATLDTAQADPVNRSGNATINIQLNISPPPSP